MVSSPVLSASKLTKFYLQGEATVHALSDVSVSFSCGELVGIVGPSGSGKSTLLSILGLVENPTSGQVLIEGSAVPFALGESKLHKLRRKKIGFIFQHFNLLPSLTASENVELPLLLNGMRRADAQKRSAELLERSGLIDKSTRFPHQLSGGEMQRVAVCRAVAHRPTLILADEPTGSLDLENGERIITLLKDLALEGHAVILATHSQRAMQHCTRIIQLSGGTLVEER